MANPTSLLAPNPNAPQSEPQPPPYTPALGLVPAQQAVEKIAARILGTDLLADAPIPVVAGFGATGAVIGTGIVAATLGAMTALTKEALQDSLHPKLDYSAPPPGRTDFTPLQEQYLRLAYNQIFGDFPPVEVQPDLLKAIIVKAADNYQNLLKQYIDVVGQNPPPFTTQEEMARQIQQKLAEQPKPQPQPAAQAQAVEVKTKTEKKPKPPFVVFYQPAALPCNASIGGAPNPPPADGVLLTYGNVNAALGGYVKQGGFGNSLVAQGLLAALQSFPPVAIPYPAIYLGSRPDLVGGFKFTPTTNPTDFYEVTKPGFQQLPPDIIEELIGIVATGGGPDKRADVLEAALDDVLIELSLSVSNGMDDTVYDLVPVSIITGGVFGGQDIVNGLSPEQLFLSLPVPLNVETNYGFTAYPGRGPGALPLGTNNRAVYSPLAYRTTLSDTQVYNLEHGATVAIFNDYDGAAGAFGATVGRATPVGGAKFGCVDTGFVVPPDKIHWLQVAGGNAPDFLEKNFALFPITGTNFAGGFAWLVDSGAFAGEPPALIAQPWYDNPLLEKARVAAGATWMIDVPSITEGSLQSNNVGTYIDLFGTFRGWWIDDKGNPIARPLHGDYVKFTPNSKGSPIGISATGVAWQWSLFHQVPPPYDSGRDVFDIPPDGVRIFNHWQD